MERADWILLQKIYREQSMSKVAEQMFVSQPTIAYRLKKIEEALGQQLFVRDNHGVQLTNAGIRLHSYAERILSLEEEINSSVRGIHTDYSGHITLGATSSFTNYYLCDQLKSFNEAYPGISVAIEISPSNRLYERYKANKNPLIIVRGNDYDESPDSCVTLIEEPLIAIAPEQITTKYLRTHPFIVNSLTHNMPIDTMIAEWIQHNFEQPPEVAKVQISADSRIMVQLVKKGFGWSIISRSRLQKSDCLYNMPIFRPNGESYRFKTQVLFKPELRRQEPYSVYISHLVNYFMVNTIKA